VTLVVSGTASAAWAWVPAISARTAKLPISSVRHRARKVPSGATVAVAVCVQAPPATWRWICSVRPAWSTPTAPRKRSV